MPKSVRLGLDLRLTPGFPGRKTSGKTNWTSSLVDASSPARIPLGVSNKQFLFHDDRDSNINNE